MFICILATIGFFSFGKLILFDDSEYGRDLFSSIIIIGGLCIFYIILLSVTTYDGKFIHFKILYINDEQFKVNNKTYDIKNSECMIDIVKKYETNSNYRLDGSYGTPYRQIKYYLYITSDNKTKKFQITSGTEEKLKDFIYNFEFEVSNFKKRKNGFHKRCSIKIL